MAKPQVTLRIEKGDTLTFTELDNNFGNLANAQITVTAGGVTSNIELNSGFTIANTATITATMTGANISLNTTAGAVGATGVTGFTGSVGAPGATGVTGFTGSQGTAGVDGATGATGPTGFTGSQGTAGANGATGATGAIGYTGSAGGGGDLSAPPPIGNVTPNTGAFTALTMTGNINMGGYYVKDSLFENVREKVFDIGNLSGTITINADNGSIQTGNVTANITMNSNNLTNFSVGETVSLVLVQATNANVRLLTSNLLYAGASKTLSTANAAIDSVHITYDGTRYLATLVKGYA